MKPNVLLKFSSKSQEDEFRSEAIAAGLQNIRLNTVVGALFIVGFIFFDYRFGSSESFVRLVWIRCGVMVPLTLSLLPFSFYPIAQKNWDWFAGIPLAGVGLGMSAMVLATGLEGFTNYLIVGVIQFQIFSFFMLGLTFRAGFVLSLASSVAFVLSTFLVTRASIPFVVANLVGTSIVLSLARWHGESQERALFRARKDLVASEQNRARADRQRIAWLGDFAKFLKHELANGITAVGSSLELVRSSQDEKYVDRAALSLGRMREMLERIGAATSIEATIADTRLETIDLSQAVTAHIDEYWISFPNIEFETQIQSGIVVRSRGALIEQMLDKLVTNAAEHCSDKRIKIELEEQDESRWTLRVSNHGNPLGLDISQLFEAFTSTKQEKSGIGLYVVRLIAEKHGGTVEASSLPTGQGASFVVSAPFDPDER